MSEEGNKKLFNHYTSLIKGGSSTERYSKDDVEEMTNLDEVSNNLIVSDAKVHLADLVKKNPSLVVQEEVKEEVKSKGKK